MLCCWLGLRKAPYWLSLSKRTWKWGLYQTWVISILWPGTKWARIKFLHSTSGSTWTFYLFPKLKTEKKSCTLRKKKMYKFFNIFHNPLNISLIQLFWWNIKKNIVLMRNHFWKHTKTMHVAFLHFSNEVRRITLK